MKIMATIMKFFGTFISIEKCGMIMAPLFTESQSCAFLITAVCLITSLILSKLTSSKRD